MAQCDACARRVRSDAQTCPYCSASLARAYYLPAWSDPDTRRWVIAGGGATLSCAALCIWMLLPRPAASESATTPEPATTVTEVAAPASLLPGQATAVSTTTTTPAPGSYGSPHTFMYGSGAVMDWSQPIEAWIERHRQWQKARAAWLGQDPEGRNKRVGAKKSKPVKVARKAKKKKGKKPTLLAKKPRKSKTKSVKKIASARTAPASAAAALRGR